MVSFSQTKKVDETQRHVLEKDEDSDPESSGVAPAPSAVAALAGLHPPTPGGHPAPDTAWKGCQLSVQVTQATGAVTIGQGLALPSLLAVRPTTAMGPAHSGGQEQAKSSVGGPCPRRSPPDGTKAARQVGRGHQKAGPREVATQGLVGVSSCPAQPAHRS